MSVKVGYEVSLTPQMHRGGDSSYPIADDGDQQRLSHSEFARLTAIRARLQDAHGIRGYGCNANAWWQHLWRLNIRSEA